MTKTYPAVHVSNPILGALATLVILVMLMAFHMVVSDAVEQGEVRRQASVLQADAIWRCKILADLPARAACLLQVNAPAESGLSGAMHASALN